ncbi:MAG: hypothetical protein K2X74_11660 [Acetobacteraceae bacterium]|nr:hypothetical protein [Acetobacteraceae bacterium]
MPVVSDFTALISGYSWTGIEVPGRPVFITYSFPGASPASHADPGAMGGATGTFQAFDAADKALARLAIGEWAAASGLVALEVGANQGDITFSWYDFSGTQYDGAGGIGFYPFGTYTGSSAPFFIDHRSTNDLAGDIMINLDFAVGGSPDYVLLLHELGHALGLKHPFETFGSHTETLDPLVDNTNNTVMSYTPGPLPTTALGPLDKDAAAHVYGAAGSGGSQVFAWSWDSMARILTQTGFNALGDTMVGVSVADSMLGQGGDDSIFSLDGNDTVNGGAGNDRIFAGSGNDSVIAGTGNDTVEGWSGSDTINGQAGDDSLDGGDGNDRLSGLDGLDTLFGGTGADRLDGGTGNDSLYGWTGNDKLFGGDDNDLLLGGDDKDQLNGDAGDDQLYGEAGKDKLWGGSGSDTLLGGDDTDSLYGGLGIDRLFGDGGNDKLWGEDDGDQLVGNDGNDVLDGGAGADNMFGNAGLDTLIGAAGDDSLNGGADADRFQFGPAFGADIVWDWQDGIDLLALVGIAGVTAIGNLTIADDGFGNTLVTAGAEGSVRLIGIAAASVTAADVVFV